MGWLRATMALGVLGCIACGPPVFRPARTVPTGEVEHVVSVAYAVEPEGVPIPSYAIRSGVADSLDLGLGIDALSSVSLDATIQLVRSRAVDLSAGPHFVLNLMTGVPAVGAPFLLDWNLGPTASFVAFAGPVALDGRTRPVSWLLHSGGGLDLRVTEQVSLRPYVGSLWMLSDASHLPYLGLAVGFGGRRDFR